MKVVAVLLFLMGLATAQSGLEVAVQRPYSGTVAGSTSIVSLSYFSPSWNRLVGFSEYGLVGMPALGSHEGGALDHRRKTSFVGLYGGHLFFLQGGRLRLGASLGTVWEETVKPEWIPSPSRIQFERNTARERKVAPYFAAKVQVLLFSFIFSSHGFGGGLNITI